MKKLALILVTTLLCAVGEARTGGPFGLGLIIGEPTALNLKYDQSPHDAFDVGLAFNFDKWALIYGDYQYKFDGAIQSLPQITPYLGFGVVIVGSNRSIDDTRHYQYFTSSTDSKWALGVRIPFGFEWRPNAPIGVFAEIAPGISLIPGTTSFFQAGVGIRYYF